MFVQFFDDAVALTTNAHKLITAKRESKTVGYFEYE